MAITRRHRKEDTKPPYPTEYLMAPGALHRRPHELYRFLAGVDVHTSVGIGEGRVLVHLAWFIWPNLPWRTGLPQASGRYAANVPLSGRASGDRSPGAGRDRTGTGTG